MTEVAYTKEERLALIKKVAERVQKRNDFKKKQAVNSAKVRRWTDVNETPKRAAKNAEFDEIINKLDENYNQWTDAPEYAKKYYGDVAYETTRYDNDWN